MAADFKVTIEIPVRFVDLDAMGHVNNAVYFTYMEEGRVAYFRKLFPDVGAGDFDKHFPFILADIQCSFKSPLELNDIAVVSVSANEMGNKSFAFKYCLKDKASGREVATGRSVQVMFDYQSQKTYPIPDDIRNKIEALEGRSFR